MRRLLPLLFLLFLPVAQAADLQTTLQQRFAETFPVPACLAVEFADLGNVRPENQDAIRSAVRYCIIQGRSPGIFDPYAPVNRAELAKIIVQAFHLPLGTSYTGFHDVPEDAWFAPYVAALKNAGIIQGYPDGTFRAGNTVTNAEFLKILFSASLAGTGYMDVLRGSIEQAKAQRSYFAGIDAQWAADRWYFPYTILWDRKYDPDGTYPTNTLNPTQHMARVHVVSMMIRVLHAHATDNSADLTAFANNSITVDKPPEEDVFYLPSWREPRMGPSLADLSLISYVSFEDPFIVQFYPRIQQVMQEYSVNLIIRPFPLGIFGEADRLESLAVLCVTEVGDEEAQKRMIEAFLGPTTAKVDRAYLRQVAELLGVTVWAFDACMDDPDTSAHLDKIAKEAAEQGVSGAPSSFLYDWGSGEVIKVFGAVSLEKLRAHIEEMYALGRAD